MRERINRLAKGIIDREAPELVIQPESVHAEIGTVGVEKGELYITSRNGLHIKGLAYSSDPRVRIVTGSFGGLRVHVLYEIECGYLDCGDAIEGSFYLVTNSGEREVPYSFSVSAGVSGRTLRRLLEPRDFAALAKRDYETAVRLFELREFADVPFMQDIHTRTLYDGLTGRGSRHSQVEQFLIALGQKKPVQLTAEENRKEYRDLTRNQKDSIFLKREGWGYLPVTVQIDGGFIQTAARSFGNEAFTDGAYEFAYQISMSGLHAGKNFGSILFETLGASVRVDIQVFQSPQGAGKTKDGQEIFRADSAVSDRFARYLSLRLDYESGKGDAQQLRSEMMHEAEQIRLAGENSCELSLMQAELCLLCGREGAAMEALSECRDQVIEGRLERPDLYCLYQYVYLKLEPDEEKWQSLGRLVRKYMEEGRGDYLLFYVFTKCEEQYCFENPGELLTRMKVLYGEGCRSPFLYRQALAVLNDAPQLLYGMGAFEVQVLYFGARRGQVQKDLAVKAAKLTAVSKYYHPLPCRMLKLLYEKYPDKEILSAVCGLMIKGDLRSEQDFTWYESALSEQAGLTKLYEYFLYSLPDGYDRLLPREVLLYFSYGHDLDPDSRAALYANIIRYMDRDTQLYHEYQKEMGTFAAEQILQSRLSSDLAVVYDAMIYPDMVDIPIARHLPSLLNSRKITCEDPKMRSVVVRYEELTEEGVYPIHDKVAYVPVFFRGSCILFQDAYGNRYGDVRHVSVPVLDRPELEERCFAVCPDHPMLLLGACRKAAEKDEIGEEDVRLMEKAMTQLKLHPLYRRELTGQLLRYYEKEADGAAPPDGSAEASGSDTTVLLNIDRDVLTRDQRVDLCRILTARGYIKEAYKMIRKYGCRLPGESLRVLCSRKILSELFDQDELLLKLSFSVFEEKNADSVILDYLCEHFNGTSEQMYRILIQGVAEHVETYDLEERLLAQMLFSGETDRMDRVFALYMGRKKTSESIVKAYFTMKSADYFFEEKPAGDDVFRYLEGVIHGSVEKDKLSALYLLALTKYYSGLAELDEEQKQLCQTMVDILLAKGIVLPYFKLLARHIRIPEDVMDKGILQYIGRKDSRVDLQVRIRPQEERFRSDEMKKVYQGVFIKQKILFEGEVMDYRIYEIEGDDRRLAAEGSLSCDRKTSQEQESRFQMLNQMALYMNLKEEAGLRRTMQDYVRKTAQVEELFGLQ